MFSEMLLHSNKRNVIGVHIRAERLGEKKEFLLPDTDRYGYTLFDWCIEQVHLKATQLANTYSADIIYLSDIGQEGTRTKPWWCFDPYSLYWTITSTPNACNWCQG